MPNAENRTPKRRALVAENRQRLTDLAADAGAAAAAALVGIHPQTYASLAAGFVAHRSTVALVERRLAELEAERTDTNRKGVR
jgi:hypothetical protein